MKSHGVLNIKLFCITRVEPKQSTLTVLHLNAPTGLHCCCLCLCPLPPLSLWSMCLPHELFISNVEHMFGFFITYIVNIIEFHRAAACWTGLVLVVHTAWLSVCSRVTLTRCGGAMLVRNCKCFQYLLWYRKRICGNCWAVGGQAWVA